eukprot:gene13131-biopygen3485
MSDPDEVPMDLETTVLHRNYLFLVSGWLRPGHNPCLYTGQPRCVDTPPCRRAKLALWSRSDHISWTSRLQKKYFSCEKPKKMLQQKYVGPPCNRVARQARFCRAGCTPVQRCRGGTPASLQGCTPAALQGGGGRRCASPRPPLGPGKGGNIRFRRHQESHIQMKSGELRIFDGGNPVQICGKPCPEGTKKCQTAPKAPGKTKEMAPKAPGM